LRTPQDYGVAINLKCTSTLSKLWCFQ